MPTSKRQPGGRASRQTNAQTGDGAPRKATSERRRDMIAIAAQLFAERGYRATTVREIGDAAGVLSGSLYHHFDSKETILDELLSDYLDTLLVTYRQVIDSVGGDPREELRGLVREAFNSLAEHRAAITVIQNERGHLADIPRFAYIGRTEAAVQRMWIEVLQRGIEEGVFRADLDPGITYRFLRDSIWVAARWFKPSGRLSSDQLADHYLKMVLDGIATSPAAPAGNGRAGRPRRRTTQPKRS